MTPAAIGNWKSRGVPIEHCPEIERLTKKGVTRPQLRPTDWERIWPELRATTEGEMAPDDESKQVHLVGTVAAGQQGVAHG